MRIIIFLVVISGFVACSDQSKNNEYSAQIEGFNPKSLLLKKERRLVFENDTIVGLYGSVGVVAEDDYEIVYGVNFMMNRIEKFKLNGAYVGTVSLSGDPNLDRIPWSEALFINRDSILLFGDGERFALINDQGTFKNGWDFSKNLDTDANVAGIDPINNDLSFFLNGNSIFVRSYPKYNWDTDWKYYSRPFMIEYDLEKNKVVRSFGEFPEYMVENRKLRFVNDHKMSWVLGKDGDLIFSLRRDPYLYKMDLTNEQVEKIPAVSASLKSFELVPRTFDSQRDTNFLISKGIYHRILYDPYRDLYYRVAVHEQPLKNEKTNRLNSAAQKVFSLIVLDGSLNYLGEVVFENKFEYSYLNFSICKEGILVPIYDNDENVVTFDIYNVVVK